MVTKNVSLTNLVNPLDPGSATNAYQVQRQQALAEALQQQSFKPMEEGKMVSGYYVAPSGAAHINKLAQQMLSIYAGNQADKNSGDLAKSNMEAIIKALDPNGPSKPVDPSAAATAALTMGAAGGSAGPTVQNAQSMDNMTAPAAGSTGSSLNPLKMNPQLAARLIMADPAKYYELQGKYYEPTEQMKNWNAQGISPTGIAPLTIAKLKKEGMLELQPGTTTVDLASGAERFQPKVGEGITMNNGVASETPGYGQAAAGIAGQVKRAEAGGNAGYKMVTVNTPNGPVMMTEEQAAQLSGGAGSAAGPVNFAGSNGTKMNFEGLTPQQIHDHVTKINDPALTQTFNEWANSGQKSPGIPLEDTASQRQRESQGKFFGDTYADTQKQAISSHTNIGNLNRLSNLLEGVETGKFTGTTLEIKKAAKAAGIDLGVGDNIAPLEAARALTSQMALIARNPDSGMGMPGAMSDADRSFLQNMQPGIETTPQGRKVMVESRIKLEQRKQDIARLAREYKGGNLDNGFFQVVQDYADAHPLFKDVKVTDAPAAAQANTGKVDYNSLYGIKIK